MDKKRGRGRPRKDSNVKVMNNKTLEEQLQDNAYIATTIMQKFLKGEVDEEEMGTKLKYANNCVTQYQKFLGTKGQFYKLNFSIAKSLAEDRKSLEKMVRTPALPG